MIDLKYATKCVYSIAKISLQSQSNRKTGLVHEKFNRPRLSSVSRKAQISLIQRHIVLIPFWAIGCSGLHKLWYPGIRDTSTWSKFGAHGEHGDVFLFSNLGAL